MANEMQAAVLYGKEDLRVESVPVPTAGPGEIVVRVAAALTCGTDLKVYRRGYHARMLKPPIAFGHELAGTVEHVGEGVTKFQPGDRVVALNSAPCGECFYCRRNQENLCDDLLFNNGAYAQFYRIPARIVEKNTLLVPDDVPLEHAALTEPLACVVRGLEESGAQPGDTLAVIGAGPIGLMFIHAAHLSGMRVIAVVKREEQVASAKLFGADHVVHLGEGVDPIAAVRELTPEARGVDIAIEAVATPLTWQWAVEMVRKGGVVNFFGGCAAGTRVELDTNRLHYNDITLKASFHHTPATCRTAFQMIRSGRFNARAYITGRAPLSEIDAVFRRLMDRSNDIKTAIIP
ncbi:zinc-dependent alcohol dehydrogenase [Acidipila rosea]|uniref:L-iditol 2-dehydrogenase n=1 Tax=Acidipila rosea TaxID=768535 RepID=A0A4R1LAM5_9BACT|nr:alcohol dehydrogenase catalytic domain-containing protein [Acidipila rosea]TCK73973.1 L-iditol 2-dehydrogenase [Acidipila rosea]